MTFSGSISSVSKATCCERASDDLSRVSVSFDESNLVPNARLLPVAVLAQRIDLIDRRNLASHGANRGVLA